MPRFDAAGLMACAVIAGALAFAGHTLLRRPCLGVADNGDYWRVMRPAGIEHPEPLRRPGQFVRCNFVLSEAHLATGISSPAVLAWVARHLPWGLFTSPEQMDLRQMGFVYLALTAVLVVLGMASRAPPLLVAAWLFVLVDPGYLLFFNSFYADSALFVGLLGIGLWLVTERPSAPGKGWWELARGLGLVSLVVLGGASKMQYILLPAVAAVALGTLMIVKRRANETREADPFEKRHLPWLLLALLLVAAVLPWHFYRGPAPRFLEVNNYHAVFAGILRVTDQPDSTLDALDIPSRFHALPRRDVWSAGISTGHPVFGHLDGLSRWRLLWIYLSQPSAVGKSAQRIASTLSTPESHRRGTFSAESGRRRLAQYSVPWQFSKLRSHLLQRWPSALWLIVAAAALWLGLSVWRRRWGGPEAGGLFLLLIAACQSAVVVLGDGFVALEQHLVGARLALDLLLVLLLHQGIGASGRLIQRRIGSRGQPVLADRRGAS